MCRFLLAACCLPSLLCLALLACDDGASTTIDAAPTDLGPGALADSGPRPDGGRGCTPREESCNGEDDDCDGRIDEAFNRLGSPCAVGRGACAADGVWRCSDDLRYEVCGAGEGAPTDEICNLIDDDCDGTADEGISVLIDPDNCGACGAVCLLQDAQSMCEGGACRLVRCRPGFVDANGDTTDGCECAPAADGEERPCNMRDDDCDGQVDEGFPLGADCREGEGVCAALGTVACTADLLLACDAVVGEPAAAEACNGLDDDCDGRVDEALPPGFDADGDGAPSCPDLDCGGCPDGPGCLPACARQDCAPDDPARAPTLREICDDGVDQNCDGRDPSCVVYGAHVDRLELAPPGDMHCRDLNGDDVPDNAFGDPLVRALANPEMARYIAAGQLSLLPVSEGLEAPIDGLVFELGVVLGPPSGLPASYTLDPASVDAVGLPLMRFPGARVDAGAVQAGPGDFILAFPLPNAEPLPLRASDTLVVARLTLAPAGLRFQDGWLSGVVTQEDFDLAVVVLNEDFQNLVRTVIKPDVDLDGDGSREAYSVCIGFDATPATVLGYPVPPSP